MVDTERWKEALSAGEDRAAIETIRMNTRTGRPLGSDSFISKLETAAGRRLRPLPHGRPRKTQGTETAKPGKKKPGKKGGVKR